MPTVRATCLLCDHAVHVPVSGVLLHRRRAIDVQGRYGFTCPSCDVFVVRHANAAVVDALLAADAPTAIGDLPPWEDVERSTVDTLTAPLTTRSGSDLPPISALEVRLFAAALDDEELAAWLSD